MAKEVNKIRLVWIFAHGAPQKMCLSSNHQISSENIDSFTKIVQEHLEENANIILYSCDTGKKIKGGENIATQLSKHLPKCTIWAPKLPPYLVKVSLKEDSSISVGFFHLKTRWDFLIEKMQNVFLMRFFKKIEVESNITVQIRNGIEIISPQESLGFN